MMTFKKVGEMVKVSTKQFVAKINAPSESTAADAFGVCGRALAIYAFEMAVLFPLSVAVAAFNAFAMSDVNAAYVD